MAQDHRKLSHDMICHTIIPLVEADPSLKVKTIISHCISVFKYRPSYIKVWLAKQKAIKIVYDNWEESYQQLPRYLATLQLYSPGTVTILETLPAQSHDGTPSKVMESSIDFSGHFDHALSDLVFASRLFKLMEPGCMGNTKEHC